MSRLAHDPLLTAARIVLAVLYFTLIALMAVLAIGIVACLALPEAHGELAGELAKAGAPASAYGVVIGIMLLIEGLLALGIAFIRQLSGIVRTVAEGDPFRPDNAERLSRMGWIALAAYLGSLVVSGIAAWLASVTRDAKGLDFDVSLGGGGLVLILTLFILARVFRQGAAMREDLEGTV